MHGYPTVRLAGSSCACMANASKDLRAGMHRKWQMQNLHSNTRGTKGIVRDKDKLPEDISSPAPDGQNRSQRWNKLYRRQRRRIHGVGKHPESNVQDIDYDLLIDRPPLVNNITSSNAPWKIEDLSIGVYSQQLYLAR